MTVQVAQVTPEPPLDPLAGTAVPDTLGADDAELKVAEAELAAAGQSLDAVAEPGQQESEPPAAEAAQGESPAGADAAAGAAPNPAETIRIPKAEFDKRMRASRVREQEARELAAYWKGVAEGGGVKPGEAAPAQPEPIQDPHEQAIRAIEDRQVAIAQDLDDGKLTTAEWRKKDLELTREREDLVAQRIENRAVDQATPDPKQDVNVQGFTRDLEETRPWLKNVPVGMWGKIRPLALDVAKANGLTIDGTAQGTINYRACLVAVLEETGLHRKFGATDAPAPAQSTPPAAPAAPRGATPAQIKAKAILQGQQPPAPTLAGQGVINAGEVTEASMADMTEAELAALPPAVLKRLGIAL